MILNKFFCSTRILQLSKLNGSIVNRWRCHQAGIAQTLKTITPCSMQGSRNYSFGKIVQYTQKQMYWIKKDNIPNGYEMIYKADKYSYITMTSFTCIFTSTVLVILSIVTLFTHVDKPFQPIMGSETEVLVESASHLWILAAIFSFITVGSMVLATRQIMRIYKNNDKYIAIYANLLPTISRRSTFKAGDVSHIKPKLGVLPWAYTLYRIGNKKVILIETNFRIYHDLVTMMGGKEPYTIEEDEEEGLK